MFNTPAASIDKLDEAPSSLASFIVEMCKVPLELISPSTCNGTVGLVVAIPMFPLV